MQVKISRIKCRVLINSYVDRGSRAKDDGLWPPLRSAAATSKRILRWNAREKNEIEQMTLCYGEKYARVEPNERQSHFTFEPAFVGIDIDA